MAFNLFSWAKQFVEDIVKKSQKPIPFQKAPITERVKAKVPSIFEPITRGYKKKPTVFQQLGRSAEFGFNLLNLISELPGGFAKGVREAAREAPPSAAEISAKKKGLKLVGYRKPAPYGLKTLEKGARGALEEIGSKQFALGREITAELSERGASPLAALIP